ncbi:MAG: arylsulfatase [Acidimicrobiia bacterium]|nr:arylsulfatase [Acidimicrobiia bacterium]
MPLSRRQLLASPAFALQTSRSPRPPNVIILITDDQGYGDLSLHGNPHLKTPFQDRIGHEGVQFTQFQVSPVCSPTRASLMTGRYNYRTGVVDTFLGRSMMHPDEVTLPELLSKAGYRTGIFGKWHLGDNHPLRSIDQGFEESVVCNGGGVGQPSDPPNNSYFNPVLQQNGKPLRFDGYCTDIFFREAMQFIERNQRQPFFAYIATNAPHTPLTVDERYWKPFLDAGLDETTAKVYGMIVNLDENVGRLFRKLASLNLDQDTILLYLTDNGPQQPRYNAGMRGRKGTVYQGGIRVPAFLRWPARLKPASLDTIAAHIDILPTMLDACGVAAPKDLRLDGRSLMPLIRGERSSGPGRTLFTQWHRGDEPELFRACAARTQQYKLVDGKELYDLAADPAESTDIAAQHPQIAADLRRQTEAWFKDVSSTRGYAPPRIYVGTPQENPVILTRQDWRGDKATWEKAGRGHWEIDVRKPARYEITLRMPAAQPGQARLQVGTQHVTAEVTGGATHVRYSIQLPAGPARLEATLPDSSGPHYVEVRTL